MYNQSDNNNSYFGIIDFIILGGLLAISLIIGLYFGYRQKKQTAEEYLLGNRKMKVLPIGISLVASQLSAFTILIIPADIYAFGSYGFLTIIAKIIVVILANWMFIPVFYNKFDNCYKYLEIRFSKTIKFLITICFIITNILLLPIFLFLPALALSQMINYNPHIINSISCTICVVYTMLGGIKAVVWTDVVQAGVMILTMIIINVLGIIKVGGLSEVWNRSLVGNRLEFDYSLDLTKRQTLWNVVITSIISWTSYVSFNQTCVQRIISVPSIQHARKAVTIFGIGCITVVTFTCFTGLIMFSYFYECDPIKAKIVQSPDKLVPYFVRQVTGHIKGMPGLFISCLFSAALSTISANLNALAGVIYFDFVKPFKYFKNQERNANSIMKLIIVIIGIYATLMGLVVEKFNSILQMIVTFMGLTHGIIFGVFTLGMLYPWANKKSVLVATIISMSIMIWLFCGAQVLISRGEIVYPKLPTSTTGCNDLNITININENIYMDNINDHKESLFSIYKISFHWYTSIGTILIWLIGIPLSHLIGSEDIKTLNPNLISPIAKCLIPKYKRQMELRSAAVKRNNIKETIKNDKECEQLVNE